MVFFQTVSAFAEITTIWMQQHKIAASFLFVVVFWLIKTFALGFLKRRSKQRQVDYRDKITMLSQLGNALMLLGLMMIWASEVQHFAISIAAFTVAIVLATRDFIQCGLGFIYYLLAKPFRVGDWVEVDTNIMGEVVEINWAKLVLLELDSSSMEYNGKSLHIPNSKLVTHMTRNLNFLKRYTIHTFQITLEQGVLSSADVDRIEQYAHRQTAEFKDVAERYKGVIERHLHANFISVEPVIELSTNEFAKTVLQVTLFCPTELTTSLQQNITRFTLSEHSLRLHAGHPKLAHIS